MKIIVCIKQVPDTADIKWTEKNTIQREGMEAIINPFDEFALETALRIKDKYPDTHITALSMGPPQAADMLRRAVAYGVDDGILLSDKKFAGADTYATGKTIAQAIKKQIPDFDIIICGQFATDGDTGQTGPAVASFLGIPQMTYVKNIEVEDNIDLIVTKETETCLEKYKITPPILVCMLKSDYQLRPALIDGYIKAHNTEIKVLSAADLELDIEEIGFKGSPTYVCEAFRPPQKSGGVVINRETPQEYAEFLDDKVRELKESFCIK